jgi:arginyl-tRNA synthetase
VYYVQYAHARICSILRKAAGHETDADVDMGTVLAALIREDADLSLLSDSADSDLMRRLEVFPETVETAARLRAPAKVVTYAEGLAASFHQFYAQCRVVTDDESLTAARLYLVDATRLVLENALGLLGVSAPQRM